MFDDLMTELKRQRTTKRDLMADTRRVSFVGQGPDREGAVPLPALMLNIDLPDGAQAFGVTRHAHGQIANHVGVPFKLYERLKTDHPDLLVHLANGLLCREPARRMLRTLDGEVRAFLSDRYRPRDNYDLMHDAIMPAMEEFSGRAEVSRCNLTETHMYVTIVLPDLEKPVTPKPGDVIRGGLIIQNSEVGAGMLDVSPYSDRLICRNGMVHTEYGQGRRHVGRRIVNVNGEEDAWDLYSDETIRLDDEAFFAKVRDTVRACLDERIFELIVADMRELAGIKISDVPAVVEVFAGRYGLSEDERARMLDGVFDESDRSAWGVLNGMTRAARTVEDADRRVELERLAGGLVADRAWAEELAA